MSNEYKRFDEEEFSEFDDLTEIFASFFKNVKRNKNVIEVCNITKQQAKQGITKNIKISVADVCKNCEGTGEKNNCRCENCHGVGFIYDKKDIVVNIPPKIKNNDYIVFEGKGNQFKANSERGKIFIKVHIYGNSSKRKGNLIKNI